MTGHFSFPAGLRRALPALQIALTVLLLALIFGNGLVEMSGHWAQAEYSHGYLIPVIALGLAWQRAGQIFGERPKPSWSGPLLLALALALYFMGELSTIYPLIQYAFLIALVALVLSIAGWRALRLLAPALTFLSFMVPIPQFFFVTLSAKLQLLSSALGVALVRLFNIPVFLEGNVIDLGLYQLQVAEACSGLRYLFPLMSLGFLVAYLFRGPFWQRVLLFLSTIPITIAMNSLRIGIIGVTVDRLGIAAAEGFIHFFEGWTIFLACLALLFAQAKLLLVISGSKTHLRDALALYIPAKTQFHWSYLRRASPGLVSPLNAAITLLIAMLVASHFIAHRDETIPQHRPLVLFPAKLQGWQGQDVPLEPNILNRLQLSDYILRDYVSPDGRSVNLYLAYYNSQRKGASVHSPHNCIPAGGWEIESISHTALPGMSPGGSPLHVNRVMIRKGLERELVYYYFDQRGRKLTEEYQAKWFIMVDSILKNRTDGALVRLVTSVAPGENVKDADARLAQFASSALPEVSHMLPQ